MSDTVRPPLDITAHWGRLNETIVTLVDYVPEDKLGWSPKPQLWNLRGILLHTVFTRDNWLGNTVQDGEETPNVLAAQSKTAIQLELRRSWERVERFLSKAERLSTEYGGERDGEPYSMNGHWVAFHLLEHDLHHRSDVFHYLALLGIEHPEIGTP